MDGFYKKSDIIVIGATNLKDSLDKAILRPGRFDKTIYFSLPSFKGRQELIQFYLQKIKHRKFDCSPIARLTVGFSPADIKNLVNIAALNAVKKNMKFTSEEDVMEAFNRMKIGI